MKKTKSIASTVQRNLERLHTIRESVENNLYPSMATIRKDVGGSSRFYHHLKHSNILIKVNGNYIWNDKIPVSNTLATTLSKQVRADHDKRLEANKEPIVKTLKEDPTRRTSHVVRTATKSDKPTKESRREFSLMWGLIKFNY